MWTIAELEVRHIGTLTLKFDGELYRIEQSARVVDETTNVDKAYNEFESLSRKLIWEASK
jgi:hypothetical protein